jgi:hypothetical protein
MSRPLVLPRLLRPPATWAPATSPITATLLAAGAVLVLAAVAVVRLRHALGAPLWIDEGISIGISSHRFADIPGLLRQDGSPPLYYLLLHVWMSLFGSTPTATHALSVTCVALAVPAAAWAAWSPFGPLAAGLAAALVALDPFAIEYADETRMYGLMLLVSVLAVGAFVRAFVLGRRPFVAVFAVALAAVLYTHNWGLFLAAALGLAYLGLLAAAPDRRRMLVDGALGFGGAVVLFAPWLPTLAFQAAHTGAPWSHRPSAHSLGRALTRMLGGSMPEALVLLVGGAGLVEIVRRGSATQRRAMAATLAAAVVTLLVAYAWSRWSSPAWALRYLVVVLAPLAVVAGAGLARSGALGVAAVVVVAAFSWHGKPTLHALTHKSNVHEAVAALAPQLPRGSLVVSTQPEQVPALRYQLGPGFRYVTPLGVVADPQVMDWRDALHRLRAARFATAMEPLLRDLPAGARVLLVQPRFTNPNAPWTRLVRQRARAWGKALRHRLRVVDRSIPTKGFNRSTVSTSLLAPRGQAP